jgi:hypothetical protein
VRINLTYFDQNESFGRALPESGLVGTVVRNVAARGSSDEWSVLQLDQPLEYQNRRHREVLIKSRWQGHAVGDREPTSVFILLGRASDVLPRVTFDLADFDHVAWGMAQTLDG